MATSEVEICNLALLLTGADRIDSLAEENQRARICNTLYANEKNSLLFRHPWNFAIRRVQLAASVTAPEFGYDVQFQLPTDCLRVLGTDFLNGESYAIEGTMLLTNETAVEIKYLSTSPAVADFSHGFCETLSYRLASKIAFALTQNAALADSLWKKAEDAENYARSFDAQEGNENTMVIADTWLNSRY